jgi:hypothetical protein
MKVFFSASVRGNHQSAARIYTLISELGFKHTSDSWGTDDPAYFNNWTREERIQHVEELFPKILKADIVVLEVTLPSFTIGQFIQYALDHKIPDLALYKKDSQKAFLEGQESQANRLLVSEYNDRDLKNVIMDGISYLKELNETRFTLIFPQKIVRHLNGVAKKGVSRSEYIRSLIVKEMDSENC